MDSGAAVHICNASMRHLYEKERESNDGIKAGTNMMQVESFGTLAITVDTPTGTENITLLHVAYIPEYLTNVAAARLFAAKRMHYDNVIPHMHRKGETRFKPYEYESYHTLTKPPPQQKIFYAGTAIYHAHAIFKETRTIEIVNEDHSSHDTASPFAQLKVPDDEASVTDWDASEDFILIEVEPESESDTKSVFWNTINLTKPYYLSQHAATPASESSSRPKSATPEPTPASTPASETATLTPVAFTKAEEKLEAMDEAKDKEKATHTRTKDEAKTKHGIYSSERMSRNSPEPMGMSCEGLAHDSSIFTKMRKAIKGKIKKSR